MTKLAIQHFLTADQAAVFTPSWVSPASAPNFCAAKGSNYEVGLAHSQDDVREAQRLRYEVFKREYGASFIGSAAGLDTDSFDPYCDHLIVRSKGTGEVVGTYRVLLPEQAHHIGRYYSQSEFFMTRIERQIPNLVELGRSCVDPEHRNGAVIMLLWSAIIRYMRHHNRRHLIGCASVSMRDGGTQAASLWNRFRSESMVDSLLEAFPKHPLAFSRIPVDTKVQEPALIRGYLKIGAKVCGEPSWDPDFNTADFLLLMDLQSMHPRYARHFGLEES
jgi:putative hemolysin